MKVLMTADTVGGVWTYALQLAADLAPHGVMVELATMGAPLREAQRQQAGWVPGLRVWESDFKLEWMDQPWDDIRRAGEWLLRIERETQPDLVHLNGYCHAALPWLAPTLVVGHSCVLSWWEAVRGEAAPAGWDDYRRQVTHGLHSARLVVAPSRAMLAALERHYGPLPPSTAIPNARDGDALQPDPKQPYILSVGRLWDEAKNVAALEMVAPQLAWPVYVAGDTQHPDGGQAELRGVKPLGRLNEGSLGWWLAGAAIFALPARYEPFGLAALEAGLAGCALVLGDIASLREVWGAAALFVPPDDSAALQATLQSLIADPLRRAALGRSARQRALRYSPQAMARAYLAAYRSLVGSPVEPTLEAPLCVS